MSDHRHPIGSPRLLSDSMCSSFEHTFSLRHDRDRRHGKSKPEHLCAPPIGLWHHQSPSTPSVKYSTEWA
eukprot:3121149-Rhodomonas_salina.1